MPDRQRLSVNLQLKILKEPGSVSVDAMVEAMRVVYETADLDVKIFSIERLAIPHLENPQLTLGATSRDHERLTRLRDDLRFNDIVVYFVNSLRSSSSRIFGWSQHPPGSPSVVISALATKWTMAHEVVHVLGLRNGHVDDNTNLMTGNGTDKIVEPPPPQLTEQQIEVIRSRHPHLLAST